MKPKSFIWVFLYIFWKNQMNFLVSPIIFAYFFTICTKTSIANILIGDIKCFPLSLGKKKKKKKTLLCLFLLITILEVLAKAARQDRVTNF